ncbi:MAG: type IV toxin-antitoxin system AbiEi family antitoxin domain-containing protein, partial [Actinomycetota bacterium]
ALAAKQHSAFSRAQALTLGFSPTEIRSRLANGAWVRSHPGVYVIAGSQDTWERRAMVAALDAGAGAAVSHRAAAYLHGLLDAPPPVSVIVPNGRRHGRAMRAKNFTRSDVRLKGEIPTTCVPRTIVDIAGELARERFEDVVDRSLVRGLATIESLRRYVAARGLGNLRGAGLLREILDDRERGIPESELERLFERVLEGGGVRLPDRQHRVGDRRVDFIYHEEKVVIEVDGRRDRSTRKRFDDDRARRNEISLALPDYVPLQFTWTHLKEEPERVIDTVKRALNRLPG